MIEGLSPRLCNLVIPVFAAISGKVSRQANFSSANPGSYVLGLGKFRGDTKLFSIVQNINQAGNFSNNFQEAPQIRKVVPVKRNGFILELQVPPPGSSNQAVNPLLTANTGSLQEASQQNSASVQNSNTNVLNQPNQVVHNKAHDKPQEGIGNSLRNFFNR